MPLTRIKGFALANATSIAALAGSAANAVEIEYWQYFFDARVTAMETLIDNFQAANPDITVKMTHFPYADYRTKVAAAIPAGEGPDVVQLFYGWLNDYVEAELIQPLPSDAFPAAEIDANFFPMVQVMKDGDNYWALPTAVRSLALFYNTRLMEEAELENPPANLDELVEMAGAMTKRDAAGNITQVGTPDEVYHKPANTFVAGFIGAPSMNMLSGTSDGSSVTLSAGQIVPMAARSGNVVLGVRPDDLKLAGGTPLISGEVTVREPLGPETLIYVATRDGEVIAKADGRTPPKVGATVSLSADPANLHLFDAVSGAALS